jgi:hypothetical protein
MHLLVESSKFPLVLHVKQVLLLEQVAHPARKSPQTRQIELLNVYVVFLHEVQIEVEEHMLQPVRKVSQVLQIELLRA